LLWKSTGLAQRRALWKQLCLQSTLERALGVLWKSKPSSSRALWKQEEHSGKSTRLAQRVLFHSETFAQDTYIEA
jgi:hypothetical protein